jgi:hypothetical protein
MKLSDEMKGVFMKLSDEMKMRAGMPISYIQKVEALERENENLRGVLCENLQPVYQKEDIVKVGYFYSCLAISHKALLKDFIETFSNNCDKVDDALDLMGNVFKTEEQVKDYKRWLTIKRQIEIFAYGYNRRHDPIDGRQYILFFNGEYLSSLCITYAGTEAIKFNDDLMGLQIKPIIDNIRNFIPVGDLVFYLTYEKPVIVLEKVDK